MDEERIRFQGTETLSRDSDRLRKTRFDLKARNGEGIHQDRETCRRGDEAFAMVERGEIVDGKTIILLQHARWSIFADGTQGQR